VRSLAQGARDSPEFGQSPVGPVGDQRPADQFINQGFERAKVTLIMPHEKRWSSILTELFEMRLFDFVAPKPTAQVVAWGRALNYEAVSPVRGIVLEHPQALFSVEIGPDCNKIGEN
jgi:hypothetical protein